ncbi:MAG: MFS transporter [Candidatus Kariarchaeaceae archaeon]|jgi:MFS family permease
MGRLTQWLGIIPLGSELQNNIKVALSINSVRELAGNLYIITAILFFLETLPPLQVATVWGIFFITQALLDYPTGNLGDAVGYKRILLAAYIFQIAAVPFLLVKNRFLWSSIFMFLFALGTSQESGALESWFDNTYRNLAQSEDPNREIYTRFQARASVVLQAMAILGFLLGGFFATLISRKFVFLLFLMLLILVFLIIQFMLPKDKPNPDAISLSKYIKRVKESLTIFIQSKTIFFYFTGIATMWAVNESIWHTYVLFKLYRDYTGSDAGAGILRSVIYFTGLLWQLLVIKIIHRFKNAHFWVFIATLVSNALFFVLIFIYYLQVPPGEFDLIAIIGFLLIYQIPAAWEALQGTLMQRINLDLIPDDYRNSLYSLLPTLARAIGIVFVLIAGLLIDFYGFNNIFYLLILTSVLGSSLLGVGLLKAPKQ